MSVIQTHRSLWPTPPTPIRFRRVLREITGPPTRLWMPQRVDTTTALTFDATVATVTHSADTTARMTPRGSYGGMGVSFASASAQTGSMPDANDLSFGNGAADSPFSLLVVANITDTAAARALVTKFNGGTGNREWIFTVTAADLLALQLGDNSVPVIPDRTSNAAITMGAWCVFGATYDGTGGATAMNGAALYQNGAVFASTATNQATYVAMEPLAAPVEIGSSTGGAVGLLDGSLALVGIYPTALSVTTMLNAYRLCRSYFGLA